MRRIAFLGIKSFIGFLSAENVTYLSWRNHIATK